MLFITVDKKKIILSKINAMVGLKEVKQMLGEIRANIEATMKKGSTGKPSMNFLFLVSITLVRILFSIFHLQHELREIRAQVKLQWQDFWAVF